MLDINGIEIKVGQTVKSQQKPGGIFNPAPPETGIVELGNDGLVIKYRRPGQNFDRFILLEGKINEIIKT